MKKATSELKAVKTTQKELTPEQLEAFQDLVETYQNYGRSKAPVHIGKCKAALIRFIKTFQEHCAYQFDYNVPWDIVNLLKIATVIMSKIQTHYTIGFEK